MTFNEFYNNIYLPAHTKKLTIVCHCIGFSLMVISVFISIYTMNFGPFSIGFGLNIFFATGSHYFYEGSCPIFIKTPKYLLWAVLSEARLWWENIV